MLLQVQDAYIISRLYDNAQLLSLYLDAYLLTQSSLFKETTHDMASYLIEQPMVSPLGGIHASEDADSLPTAKDSQPREGAFYVWTMDEFRKILSKEEVEICTRYWNVKPEGNVDERYDSQGEFRGQNTLCISMEPADLGREFNKPEEEIRSLISNGRQKLLVYRDANRPRPALDDKIVTAWNGLAISGLARAGVALDEPRYTSAAIKASQCIQEHLYDDSTRSIKRIYREGPGETPGFADDYAFLIAGLIDLYGATFDDRWLSLADTLQKTQIEQFWDADNHGFFSTPAGQPDILVRSKDAADNAEPGINGVSAANLLRLAALLDDQEYDKRARETLAAFAGAMREHPAGYSSMMSSVAAATAKHDGMANLVVSGRGPVADAVVRKFAQCGTPRHMLVRIGGESRSEWLRHRNGLLSDLDPEREMVQLCENSTCRLLEGGDVEKLFVD